MCLMAYQFNIRFIYLTYFNPYESRSKIEVNFGFCGIPVNLTLTQLSQKINFAPKT